MKTRLAFASLAIAAAGSACSRAAPVIPDRAPVPASPITTVRASEAIEAPKSPSGHPFDDSIYFSFDTPLIRDDARPVLQEVARRLQANPQTKLRIEGHCDERGTTEYNLALGDKRARAAQQYLLHLGIPENRIEVVTYGSERPKSHGHDESAWTQNRRDDFRIR